MLLLLRKIRITLLQDNKIFSYLLYAVGEILLVVIGILIAVSIDDWNETRNNRIREVQYLRNIKLDLQKDMTSLEILITTRHDKLRGTEVLPGHVKGEPIEDLTQVIYDISLILGEGKFVPSNTTFNELSNSGNLNSS